MKNQAKTLLILIGPILALLFTFFFIYQKKEMKPVNKKDYYQITCGVGEYQTLHIATKKKGSQYFVRNEYRSFDKNCVVKEVVVK